MGRKKRSHKRQEDKKLMKMLCEYSENCPNVTTCPTLFHRMCNAPSKCCKRCRDYIICPMKGIK